MTSSTDTTSAADERLRRLVARGFRFMHPRDEQGEILAVVGVRAHDNVIDAIRLQDENDVVATRMPGSEENILAPTRVSWQSTGSVCEVIDDLLDLPDDRTPGSLIIPGSA
ncbi:hypothetical protein [Haloactinomyces albus]|uniref:Uncharacterized protein n=1 Tax=Haloactinomyces albus TaxID=1352928 RepID=A0AAE3ZH23_9ACTN|nr:hypothetical protein [Haloactinomyces albus]MDR7302789.1 hypothetical protein [Haloactinomyces albus]